MKLDADALLDAWATLAAASDAPTTESLVVRTADATVPGGLVLCALDGSGNRRVLLPLNQMASVQDTGSQWVRATYRRIGHNDSTLHFVDLACLSRDLDDVFAILASDLVDEAGRSTEATDVIACRELARWRDLLDDAGQEVSSEESFAALIAEVYQLREIRRRVPVPIAVWQGPLGGRHDFVGPHTRIEVKSSLNCTSERVRIHGLEQLAVPANCLLYLVQTNVVLDPPEGETFGQLLESLVELGFRLVDILRVAGLGARRLARLSSRRFGIPRTTVRPVGPGFPRLVPQSLIAGALPDGVSAVDYDVDLSLAPPPLSPDAVERVLQGFNTYEASPA